MNAKMIETKQFARGAFGTYKADDVDVFFQQVLSYVKQLEKDAEEQLHNMKLLADKIEEYRSSEDAVREALVKAQKYATKVINDAQSEAEEINNAAMAKAAEIITEAQTEAYAFSNQSVEQTNQIILELKNKALVEINELKQKAAIERQTLKNAQNAAYSFKLDLIELYRAHIDLINRIPDLKETDYVPEQLPKQEVAAETVTPEKPQQTVEEVDQAEPAFEDVAEEAPVAVPTDSEETKDFAPTDAASEEQQEPAVIPESDGDTKVIAVEDIDGDTTPDDIRRTMQDISKPVYGRKFTDLKFGSGK